MIEKLNATCWLNESDYKSGDAKSLAYAWAPKLTRKMLPTLLGAALPATVKKGTLIDVKLSLGQHWVHGVPVIDIGPWRTDDAYWTRNGRPAAESMKGLKCGWDKTRKGWFVEARPTKYTCNGAGIDLTPAVWEQLYGEIAGSLWTKSPGDLVDIVVHEPGVTAGGWLDTIASFFGRRK